jgi:hypothetical protein
VHQHAAFPARSISNALVLIWKMRLATWPQPRSAQAARLALGPAG